MAAGEVLRPSASDAGRPRVCVVNLGCKVNRVESDWMEASFADAGAVLAPEGEADIVAVNTCAVTGEAEAKTRKAVRRAAGLPQRPLVAVTGCVANLFPSELEELGENVLVLPGKATLAADALAAWCERARLASATPASAAPGAPATPEAAPGESLSDQPHGFMPEGEPGGAPDAGLPHGARHGAFRSRRGVKVQDGCDNRCTYCIVWKARGPVRSTPLADIERQVSQVLAEGADEVVLSGINLGRFRGVDASGAPVDLGGLVERVCSLGARMVRLSSIEPPDLTASVLDAMARHPREVAAHLHLPLQSGCTATLRRMGRSYTADEFARVVGAARSRLPGLSLSTDVIVGFPGETDAEFEETLAFCRRMRFSKMHVFRYSARPGTAAASYPDQVAPEVSRTRSERLRTLADELRAADAAGRVGTAETVLVEYVDPDGGARGTSASYHDVALPAGSHSLTEPGLVRVRFERAEGMRLVGRALG